MNQEHIEKLPADELNQAIATHFWNIPEAVQDAPYFLNPDYCNDWQQMALIVAEIHLNGSEQTKLTFDQALRRYLHATDEALPKLDTILTICGPMEVCIAALTAKLSSGQQEACTTINLPYLEQQHQGEEIDQAIAVHLFGWPAEVVQDPNFPLPAYSTNSATTCKILEKVMSLPEQQRERFRTRVQHWLPDGGKNLPFEQLLYFATEPGIVCLSALYAMM